MKVSNPLQTALQHHLAGRLEEAEAIYQALLQDTPEHSDALHLSGEIAYQRGQFELAIKLIKQALALNPSIPSYYGTLGRVYKNQGNMDEAIACYQQALAIKADDAIVHNSLGNVFFDQGRFADAIASYQTALSFQPDLVEVHCNMGNALQAYARLDDAVQSYLNALALKPDHIVAYNKLGNVLLSQGKVADAQASYDIALALDPDVAETHCNLGNVYQVQDKLDEAVTSYRNALSLKPDFPEAYNNLGNTLQTQAKPDEAIVSFQHALKLNPEYVDAHNNLGNALKVQGKLIEAIACYRQALALRPDSAVSHFNLGNVLMEQGKLDQAVTCYRSAIAYRPDYVQAHCNLGVALKEQHKYDEALSCYQNALAIAPDWVDALYNLGVMYGLIKQSALAEQYYRKALQIDPELVSAHANLSAILRDRGLWDEAQHHRDLAYRKQCVFITRSPHAARTVLMLLDAGKANVPFPRLFPLVSNSLIEWMIEYATPDQYLQLPAYDLVFNAIGDPDVTEVTAQPVADFLQHCDKPVLNSPQAVARTPRHLMSQLFGDIEGLVIPAVWRVQQHGDWFINPDFQFPALARPLASHGGEGVFLVQNASELAKVPLDRSGSIYLCAYYDYRSADGYFRKYRIIFVDRKPYPYHLAISEEWMVHYETANMSVPWKLLEEERFLQDPAKVLGAQGMALITAIGQRLDLDYGGVDFSILPDGKLLLFEANATMLVHPEEDNEDLMFKNPYVQKIFDAFSELLTRSTAKTGR